MKNGYKKLQFCGQQAARDRLDYFWVDTCCIDKSSSAELQEAINSMFRWYKNAKVCYVFLSDHAPGKLSHSRSLGKCRWVTRGWTLQELIAPLVVKFYAKDWSLLGDKKNDAEYIADATGINLHILKSGDLSDASVAQRMSWAAKRNCTRLEDVAYSLMGLFGINMPMLYGEGSKAFRRLQEEIIKSSNDLTIFAWNPAGVVKYCSILAPCPAVFSESVDIEKFNPAFSHPEFTVNNKGLRMTTSLWRYPVEQTGAKTLRYFLRLGGDPSKPTGVFLIMVGPGYFFRDGHMPFSTASKSIAAGMRTTEIYIATYPLTTTKSIDLTSFSQISFVVPSNQLDWKPTVAIPEELWDDSNSLFFGAVNHIIQVLKLQLRIPNTSVKISVVVLYDRLVNPGASLIFNPEDWKRYGRLTRYLFRPRNANERFRMSDLLWEYPEIKDLTDHFEVIVSKERYTIKSIMQLGLVEDISTTMRVYSLAFEVSKEQSESLVKGLLLRTRK
ncbi:hypothetical protein BGZ60DRAFT_401115 [Tricladium varicosporioides]|nr:hypothetical protein BGZ60DRAFT_401115 [Hymenoscyphus varicosporioides]